MYIYYWYIVETESENSPESLSEKMSHNLPDHYDDLSKIKYQ